MKAGIAGTQERAREEVQAMAAVRSRVRAMR
jgi:hypothetical protein